MTLEDAFNARFQELLYALVDSKADGLRDCTVTEVVNVAAVAFGEAGKDIAFAWPSFLKSRVSDAVLRLELPLSLDQMIALCNEVEDTLAAHALPLIETRSDET